MALFVAVAHSGKSLQLGVQPTQRVEAVQQALVTFTGIPIADQIVMLAGSKLDATRPLSAYKLPLEDLTAAADSPVILYCKSYLRPDGPVPPLEILPPITPQVPPALGSAALAAAVAAHPLSQSSHAVVRALPSHEAAFSHHVAKAAAYLDASVARLHRCRQLLSEQEVQSRAADAATVNVEAHYAFISSAMTSFTTRYNQQCADHAQLLASFSEDQALLDSIPLHPSLAVGSAKRLSELPGAVRAREVAATCRKHHGQLAEKVSQLEGVYDSMKLDMEALIMQAPAVDLDALGLQLREAEGWVEEQGAIMQVLSKDLSTLQQLVERVVRQSAAGGSAALGPEAGGESLLDACVAVGALAAAHEGTQLPRVEALDAAVAVLEERCAAAKARMTADVIAMLQCISQQQSKIRDMRSRLAGFDALLQRQATMFNELRPLGRLPAAYRGVLAECERVRAWHQLKAEQASEFVDQMVAQYQAEAAKRKAFIQQVERYLPSELLSSSGLQDASQLGLPTVSVPPAPPHLLPVSLRDVQRLPSASPGVATAMVAMSQLLAAGPPPPAGAAAGASAAAAGDELLLSQMVTSEGGADAGGFAPLMPDPTSMHRLEMENARLRTELADLLVEVSLARLQAPVAAVATGGPAPASATSGGLASSFMPGGTSRGLTASQAPHALLSAQSTDTPQVTPRQQSAAGGAAAPVPVRQLGSSTSGGGSSWRRSTGTSAVPTPASPHGSAGATPPASSLPAGTMHSRHHSYTPGHASQHSLGTSPGITLLNPPTALHQPLSTTSHATPLTSGPLPSVSQPGALSRQPSHMASSVAATPTSPAIQTTISTGVPGAGLLRMSVAAGWGTSAAEQQQLQQQEAALAALQQAAAMKEAYCAALQHEVNALGRRLSTYEGRIIELEGRLAGRPLSVAQQETDSGSTGQGSEVTVAPVASAPAAATVAGAASASSGRQQEAQEQQTQEQQQPRLGADSQAGLLRARHQLQQQQQQDTPDDFDPLACSSYGDGPASGSQMARGGASTDAILDRSGEASGIQPEASSSQAPASSSCSYSTVSPATSRMAGVGVSSAAVVTQATRSNVAHPAGASVAAGAAGKAAVPLGPIALAAMGGSRGHTPEPLIAHGSAQGSTGGGSGRGGAGSGGGGGAATGMLLMGSRAATPDQPAGWEALGGAGNQGLWANHPHPLFRGRWGSAVVLHSEPTTESVVSGPVDTTAGGTPSQELRGHSHDGVLPAAGAGTEGFLQPAPLPAMASAPVPVAPVNSGIGVEQPAAEAAAAATLAVLRPVAAVGVPVMVACEAAVALAVAAGGRVALSVTVSQPPETEMPAVPPSVPTDLLPAWPAEQVAGTSVMPTDSSKTESGQEDRTQLAYPPAAAEDASAVMAGMPEQSAVGAASSSRMVAIVDVAGTAPVALSEARVPALTLDEAVATLDEAEIAAATLDEGRAPAANLDQAAAILDEDEDDAVPDINDLMLAGETGGVQGSPRFSGGGNASGAGEAGHSAGGGVELRTWPAAGSGLGASMLGEEAAASTSADTGAVSEQQPTSADVSAVTLDPATAQLSVGGGKPVEISAMDGMAVNRDSLGHVEARDEHAARAEQHASGDERDSEGDAGLQASMYASAMGTTMQSSAFQE